MAVKDYEKEDQWFVSGWFKPTTERDKRNATTLCNIIGKKQSKFGVER